MVVLDTILQEDKKCIKEVWCPGQKAGHIGPSRTGRKKGNNI
jgi:hypothetical protein